jgi:hypothetical protein
VGRAGWTGCPGPTRCTGWPAWCRSRSW